MSQEIKTSGCAIMDDTINVLVIDGDAKTKTIITNFGAQAGFNMEKETIEDPDILSRIETTDYNILVMDVDLLTVDGWTLCKQIRKFSDMPIIILSEKDSESDKLLAFEVGVDDYMVKPISPKELVARIKIHTRKGLGKGPLYKSNGDIIKYCGLQVNLSGRQVLVDEEEISLTQKEYELLLYFMNHPSKAVSRDVLIRQIWGYEYSGVDRTIDTHIKTLREKLGPYKVCIMTIWGYGYKFEEDCARRLQEEIIEE